MGHRHLPNSLPVLTGQSQNSYNATSEHPYTGRVVGLENGSLAYPIDAVSRGSVQPASHWNSERVRNDYPSSSFSMGVPNIQPAFSDTLHDPFPHSSDPGSSYLPPEGSTSFSQSYYYERCYGYESELDSAANIARRQLKRRSPELSVPCERDSIARFHVAGSSSSFSGQTLQRPTSDYQGNPYDPIGFPHNGGASQLSAGEGSSRNVRRRPGLDSLTNPQPTQSSGYSSHYYHTSTASTYREGVAPTSMRADWNTRQWNVDALPPAAHARMHVSGSGGSSNENSHLLPRGNGREIHGIGPVSSRNHNSSSTYFYDTPSQVAAESYANHHQREIPTYSSGLSYSNLGGEAASTPSTGNSLPSLPSVAETYASGQSRPSAGGWRNNHRTGRSRIATERFRTFSGIADAHSRNGSQNFNMMDHSAFYASSRDLFDQYEDMRLDVDNMSYEELISLGERIGSVNTGVSEDMISKCLTEKVYSSDQNCEEDFCAICLEEYTSEEMAGTLKKCGHNYHGKCIRKWLSMKNACPICKAPAHADV